MIVYSVFLITVYKCTSKLIENGNIVITEQYFLRVYILEIIPIKLIFKMSALIETFNAEIFVDTFYLKYFII